jgi:hypothetical protein
MPAPLALTYEVQEHVRAPGILRRYVNIPDPLQIHAPTASSIFHLRYGALALANLVWANIMGQIALTDSLIIHICNQRRVSKNIKELSHNCLTNTNPLYLHLKLSLI